MLDLLKTFLLSIATDKRYRWVFLFILLTLFYRSCKSLFIYTQEEMAPVKFISLNENGTLNFLYLSNEFTLYPEDNLILPNKKSKNKCEKTFFEKYYQPSVEAIIGSSSDGKFIVRLNEKFPRFKGEAYYYNENDDKKSIYKTLEEQEILFINKKNFDFCEILFLKKAPKNKKIAKQQ